MHYTAHCFAGNETAKRFLLRPSRAQNEMSTTAFSIFSVLLIEEKSRYTTVDAHIFQQYRIATFNDCWFFCLDLRFSQAGLGYIQSTYDQFFSVFYVHTCPNVIKITCTLWYCFCN